LVHSLIKQVLKKNQTKAILIDIELTILNTISKIVGSKHLTLKEEIAIFKELEESVELVKNKINLLQIA